MQNHANNMVKKHVNLCQQYGNYDNNILIHASKMLNMLKGTSNISNMLTMVVTCLLMLATAKTC